MADNMNLRLNEKRERRLENLEEATGENTKSGAIDAAAEYYIKMSGGTTAMPTGAVEELMHQAVEEGSLTPEQIAQVLNCEELPVEFQRDWGVGGE